MAPGALEEQGARCMDCGVPFCQGDTGCPVRNVIPEWNDLVFRGRWREASDSLHATNNFPELTGRLCPAPCESACVLSLIDDPVAIRTIEQSIADRGFAEGWITPRPPRRETGRRVAIIGSGPAGLAAAQQLRRLGHAVTVFEKSDRIGGLLRYGIPEFKLEKSVLDRRLAQLTAEGVVFRPGVDAGVTMDVASLRRDHDAVLLAMGAEQPRELQVPGRVLRGVHLAMDFLAQQNRRLAGDAVDASTEITARGKRVVIIGGGDTGSDCAGTCHRQGARSVQQFELLGQPPAERSPATPWPLWPMTLRSSHAHEEGAKREWSVATTAFSEQRGECLPYHHCDRQRRRQLTVEPPSLQSLAPSFRSPLTSSCSRWDSPVRSAAHCSSSSASSSWTTAPCARTICIAPAFPACSRPVTSAAARRSSCGPSARDATLPPQSTPT